MKQGNQTITKKGKKTMEFTIISIGWILFNVFCYYDSERVIKERENNIKKGEK